MTPKAGLAYPAKTDTSVLVKTGGWILAAAAIAGLYWMSRVNYLLFHSVIEGYSTVIAFAIFIQGWNTRRYTGSSYLVYLGIAYFFVGLLDLLHALAYEGMGVFSVQGSNLPTQLWVAGRYLESIAILSSFILIKKRIPPYFTLGAFSAITTLLILSIFYWRIFPVCYVEGVGLTDFKIISEYLISAVLFVSMMVLHRKKQSVDPYIHKLLFWSIALTIFSELAFSVYIDVEGNLNTLGHLLKIVSFYLIYKAIVVTSFTRPLALLFRELKEQELKLKEDLETIKALEKERDTILSILVHDMKTPLVSIMGFSNMILKKQESLDNAKINQYTETIFRQGKQLEKLIFDFLDSSRNGDSRLHLNLEDCDLRELVDNVTQGFAPRCAQRGIKITTQMPQCVLNARVDRTRLERALNNLLDNALRFSPENGEIFMRLQSEGQRYVLEVEDQGPGIAEDDLQKVCKPFFRGKGPDNQKGYGLGLAGVKIIAESHGGEIKVKSSPSGGALFSIILPSAQP